MFMFPRVIYIFDSTIVPGVLVVMVVVLMVVVVVVVGTNMSTLCCPLTPHSTSLSYSTHDDTNTNNYTNNVIDINTNNKITMIPII